MNLKPFGKYAVETYCPHCDEYIEKSPETFILFSTDKYHGINKASSHTASLFIDGDNYASIHVDKYDSDAGGDVAHLQLGFIPHEKRTKETAQIVSDFAKWARFDWFNPDKKTELPTLVRLIGITTDKTKPFWYEIFTVLPDARTITVDHLDWKVTSRDVND
jgi:hypothetical protein